MIDLVKRCGIVLGVFALTAGSLSWGGLVLGDTTHQLVEIHLPADVQAAVATNYDIGRGAMDRGGISTVQSFSLEAFADLPAEEYFLFALQALIAEVDPANPAAPSATCGLDPDHDQWTPIVDPAACAAWHLERATTTAARHDLESLRIATYGSEARQFNDSLSKVMTYLYKAPEQRLEVVSFASDVVDMHVAILIDRARHIAHIVSYDWGA